MTPKQIAIKDIKSDPEMGPLFMCQKKVKEFLTFLLEHPEEDEPIQLEYEGYNA